MSKIRHKIIAQLGNAIEIDLSLPGNGALTGIPAMP
jgi:hypothetical protein